MAEWASVHPMIRPDQSRLVARPFLPGTPNFGLEPGRLDHIVDRIVALPDDRRRRLLADARSRASGLFDDIESTWLANVELAVEHTPRLGEVTDSELRLLVGAYLTQAYAYEGVALTNPSLVPFGVVDDGAQPFVMSARAIGEGHISSIAFITGVVEADGRIHLDPRHPGASNGRRRFPPFGMEAFAVRLEALRVPAAVITALLNAVEEGFAPQDLDAALRALAETDIDWADMVETTQRVHWLASSNYEVSFDPGLPVSEHLLSPGTPIESHGMEDARFVRLARDDGTVAYCATYTAYDGVHILPQLIETADFHSFRIGTLTGPAAHHKGMALFPRQVQGDYLALSRHDQERIFLMRSDDITTWANAQVLLHPEKDWELVQNGNCGSPIETEAGWLVITHGVGPMRRYVLGAVLLDLDEPSKVLGRLDHPLLEPDEFESVGLVPNVVYSCGSMVHGDLLVVPYGYADYGIRFFTTGLRNLIDRMS